MPIDVLLALRVANTKEFDTAFADTDLEVILAANKIVPANANKLFTNIAMLAHQRFNLSTKSLHLDSRRVLHHHKRFYYCKFLPSAKREEDTF